MHTFIIEMKSAGFEKTVIEEASNHYHAAQAAVALKVYQIGDTINLKVTGPDGHGIRKVMYMKAKPSYSIWPGSIEEFENPQF